MVSPLRFARPYSPPPAGDTGERQFGFRAGLASYRGGRPRPEEVTGARWAGAAGASDEFNGLFVLAGGGVEDCLDASAPTICARLCSAQQVGQRHSKRRLPSAAFPRVSRHPNWALMSV